MINGHTRILDAKIADESGKKPFRMRSYTVIVANIRPLRPAETPANSDFVGERAQFGTKPAEYVLTFTDAYDSWAGQYRFGRPFTERLLCLVSIHASDGATARLYRDGGCSLITVAMDSLAISRCAVTELTTAHGERRLSDDPLRRIVGTRRRLTGDLALAVLILLCRPR